MPCPEDEDKPPMKWVYGVTTVPHRKDDVLPKTLSSLRLGGFDAPHLFVDGSHPSDYWKKFGLEYTVRSQPVRAVGNWVLAIWELFIRNPAAHRYAIFQDDMICYRNLRQYLEQSPYPSKGYLNLYTFRGNEQIIKNKPYGWYEAEILDPTRPAYQSGRGGVALVFSRDAVLTLLPQPILIEKHTDAHMGDRKLDGMVVTAFNHVGWREYVHSPSLVQHTGKISSIGNRPQKLAHSFLGEDYDALRLLAPARS